MKPIITITTVTTICHPVNRATRPRRLPPPPVVGRSYSHHIAAVLWCLQREARAAAGRSAAAVMVRR